MRYDLTKIQIEAIAAMLRDELGDDERAYVDTLEGETDLFEWVRRLLDRIEDDEGNAVKLAEQIAARELRKSKAVGRISTNRKAIQALLECAKLDKLVLPEATLSVRDVPPKIVVTDDAAVPDDLCRIKRTPDMAAIKAEVEAGRSVSGVALGNGGTTLTIRRK